MDNCPHKNLVLVPPPAPRWRCRHCHLTIKPEELEEDYCPECYAETGQKRSDFEELEAEDQPEVCYRCEDCGAIIH
ncbi:MAG: hypothetical protein R6U29_04995 [Desulfosudaceae bacterium]